MSAVVASPERLFDWLWWGPDTVQIIHLRAWMRLWYPERAAQGTHSTVLWIDEYFIGIVDLSA